MEPKNVTTDDVLDNLADVANTIVNNKEALLNLMYSAYMLGARDALRLKNENM